ncbi:hypothetical protein EDC04DRAFT_2894580 [Pisolithus marmoratus]|nr:hypothetical protein EDC04DRAFT_2894580 [Pisolithus marmoratus]
MELRENLEMKSLLDKILDTFPWWEDLHGFWRMNLSYNTVFSMANPSQDYAMEAQQFFSGEKSTATTELLPLVSASPSGITDDNIDPLLWLTSTLFHDSPISAGTPIGTPASTYSKVTTSSIPTFPEMLSQSVLADVKSPSAISMLKMLSSHALKATSTTSTSRDKGKTKVAADAKSTSLNVPSHAPSSSGSSVACKQSWDAGSEISAKLSEASDTLIQQIQNSAKAKSETKWLKIQAQVIRKELKAHNKTLRVLSKTKQMELELRLEEARIAQLEAERHVAAVEEGN